MLQIAIVLLSIMIVTYLIDERSQKSTSLIAYQMLLIIDLIDQLPGFILLVFDSVTVVSEALLKLGISKHVYNNVL